MQVSLLSKLKDYLKMENPQFAVLLTGEWGCGKIHYIKNIIENQVYIPL
ncbi:MAG: KAP family NTPase [Deferribacteraceae bacterium]|jgi:hypothetical protein|nr:KAP family NTPase [Deferribacteraceae bacterium]